MGYSERVRGFAPLPAVPIAFSSSGIQWSTDTAAHEAFAVLHLRDDTDGTLHHLRFETAEALHAAGDELRRAVDEAAGGAVPWQGLLLADGRPVLESIESRFKPQLVPSRRTAADLLDAAMPTEATASWLEPDTARLTSLLAPGVRPLPHQVDGLRWLWTRYELAGRAGAARGVVLADDMGLGKTFQLACVMALARQTDRKAAPHLVVAPKILLENWQAELRKYFTPRTLVTRIVEASSLRPGGTLVDRDGVIDERVLESDDVWLLSYDTLQSFGPALLRPDWHIVVLDEAQAIKNAATARSRNARGLKARFSVASTGTPIENATADLYAITDFACPGVVAVSRHDFDERYPAERTTSVDNLRRRLGIGAGANALLLRREKAVVLRSLPEKRQVVAAIPMTTAQRDTERRLAQARTRGGAFELLGLLQKLYQHPALLDATERSDTDELSTLMRASPKLVWLRETLRAIAAMNEKVLIFTVWTRMQGIIVRLLTEEWPSVFGRRNVVINGAPQNMGSAHARIARFSETAGFDALVMSPLAAGTGLTITAATHVIHYGRWWNPAREDQATDRAHRIGQTRPVTVWVPVLHHPDNPRAGFDMGLHQLVERKRSLAQDFLSPTHFDVSDDEFNALQEP